MHSPHLVAAASAALLLAATMPQRTQAREIVGFSGVYSSGTVVVKTTERALYYVLGNGKAVRYRLVSAVVASNGPGRPSSPEATAPGMVTAGRDQA
jgi:lipoprotein-anchoring transpeptidase ErfK/SrfK